MVEQIKEHKRNLLLRVEEHIIQPIFESTIINIEWVEKTYGLLSTFVKELPTELKTKKERNDFFNKLVIYRKTLIELLDESTIFKVETFKKDPLHQYLESIEEIYEKQEAIIHREQDKERYVKQPSDGKRVAFLKRIKYLSFKFSNLPTKFTNIFRKKKRPILFNNQEIFFEGISKDFFTRLLPKHLSESLGFLHIDMLTEMDRLQSIDLLLTTAVEELLNSNQSIGYKKHAESIDELLNIDSPFLNREAVKKEITDKTFEAFEELFNSFSNQVYKLGTFELSNRRYTSQRNNKRKLVVEKSRLTHREKWWNTYCFHKDDWGLDQEIYYTNQSIITNYEEYERNVIEGVNDLAKTIQQAKLFFESAFKELYETVNDTEITKFLRNKLVATKKELSQGILDVVVKKILELDLSENISVFQNDTLKLIQEISKSRMISTKSKSKKATPNSEINFISPFELVNYESWPSLNQKIDLTKININRRVSKLIDDINDLGQATTFNLEAALSIQKEESTNSPKDVASEMFERNQDRVATLINELESFTKITNEQMVPALEAFTANTKALTKTENIIQIKLTIGKAKSIEKSKAIKRKVLASIKGFIPVGIHWIKTKYQAVKKYIVNYLKRNGFLQIEPIHIENLSTFLKEADKSIDALPFVYQRLFRSTAIQNLDLLITREGPIEKFEASVTSWEKNQFSPILISGEKGSGKSSFVHYCLNKQAFRVPQHIISLDRYKHQSMNILNIYNSHFKTNFESDERLIQELQTIKQVMIIENLEVLFTRSINGFSLIHHFLHIISKTYQHTFWVVTCTSYTLNFLNKAILLQDQFSKVICIEDDGERLVSKTINKHHRLSGYQLNFDSPPEAYQTKKFLKMSQQDQQVYLKESYYNDIEKLAKGNFKIGFTYWLRSIHNVTDNAIAIRSMKSLGFPTLNKLSLPKLTVLHNLLIHGSLDDKMLQLVCHLPVQEIRHTINSLFESGVLVRTENNFYSINILLYRQAVNILHTKNFMH